MRNQEEIKILKDRICTHKMEIPLKDSYYGYVRVSTQMQADEGISLENQEKKIEAWGVLHDKVLVKTYADRGISGRSMKKRPGLNEVLEIIKEGQTLVVYSFSRLSRSVHDFLEITAVLDKKNCQLVIMKEGLDTSTAHGRFVGTMFAALAQLESDITSERVKDAMQYKISKKEFVGRPPYGWKLENGKGSNLVEVEEEQKIINQIKQLRVKKDNEKQLSYQKIANILNETNVQPPGKSKIWYHPAVNRICNRGEIITKGRSINSDNK